MNSKTKTLMTTASSKQDFKEKVPSSKQEVLGQPITKTIDLVQETKKNEYFRKVIQTTESMQLVLMSIHNQIELELHEESDQFFMVVEGKISILVSHDRNEKFDIITVESGQSVIVPKNTWHWVINMHTSNTKLYTIYSPPHHAPDALVMATNDEAYKY
jgi:mannose-6-phosphate isomerase-like protein (cupin superfamily)